MAFGAMPLEPLDQTTPRRVLDCSLLLDRFNRACRRRMGFEPSGCPSDISSRSHGSDSLDAPPSVNRRRRSPCVGLISRGVCVNADATFRLQVPPG